MNVLRLIIDLPYSHTDNMWRASHLIKERLLHFFVVEEVFEIPFNQYDTLQSKS